MGRHLLSPTAEEIHRNRRAVSGVSNGERAGEPLRVKGEMMNRMSLVLAAAATALALSGCAAQSAGDTAVSAPNGGTAGGAAGICAEGATDCVDTPQLRSDDPVAIDETGIRQFRKDAKYYLGRTQDELTELIRVARIDDEQFALTEDYQVGRITVELDDVEGDGKPIVTSATVELPDGPETFKLNR